MRRLVFALIIAVATVQPALAASCYTPEVAAAESAIRLHSKLMVIALTCKIAGDGSSMTDTYAAFGRKHNAELREAESTMIGYYKQNGKSAVSELDHLRTVLGNQYATESAEQDPHEFCRTEGPMLAQATGWSPTQFHDEEMKEASGRGLKMCN